MKKANITLQFDPAKSISRAALLNNLAEAARVVHGDPTVRSLTILVLGARKKEYVIKVTP